MKKKGFIALPTGKLGLGPQQCHGDIHAFLRHDLEMSLSYSYLPPSPKPPALSSAPPQIQIGRNCNLQLSAS